MGETCYLCNRWAGDDEWCYGCRHYICSNHPTSLLGDHEARDHDAIGSDEEGC